MLDESDIPNDIWDEAIVHQNEEVSYYRMDTVWHHIATMRAPDSRPRFARLCRIAKLTLVLPHSNAQEERVFSMVQKNKTAFRPLYPVYWPSS